jgi:hypothetical protein
MTRDADFKAIVRARARQHALPYTQARRETLARRRAGSRQTTLHVTSGDSTAGTIARTGVDGPILAWRDILHDGPVPAGLSPAELRLTRARFLAGAGYGRLDALRRDFAARDAQLRHPFERYVLWFEADLYDQLQLIQVLDALAGAEVAPERIALVSAGEFPGVAHFGGLGELPAEALAGLFEQRVSLTAEAVELARTAWAAFRAPDPSGLAALEAARSRELRFLGEAIGRLLQEYPWRADGLSLTQRRILHAVADGGASAAELFRRVWARERRPYLGDSVLFGYVRALAGGEQPLLAVEGDGDSFDRRTVTLTEMGRFVVVGAVNALTLNGIDRWIGGVHLTDPPAWRYDERRETIVPG